MIVGTVGNRGYVQPPLIFTKQNFHWSVCTLIKERENFIKIARLASLADKVNGENTHIPLLPQIHKPSNPFVLRIRVLS